MRLLVSILALAAMLQASVAQAQDCFQAAKDQRSLDECAGQQFAAADKQLNDDFREIQKRLGEGADSRKKFIEAQRAWIAFRDAECAFQTSGVAEGSLYPMALAQCKTSLTTDRVKQFKAYLACEEGDLSCPVPGR